MSGNPVQVTITGMHCASCVRRVEQCVERLPGIDACQVDLIGRQAHIVRSDDRSDDNAILAAIDGLGFTAQLAGPGLNMASAHTEHTCTRAIIAAVLAVACTLVVHLPFTIPARGWIATSLAALTVLWPGLGVMQRGLRAVLRLRPDMDTLILFGAGAAVIGSVLHQLNIVATGMHAMAGSMIVALVVLGRYVEERARQRGDQAISDLLERSPEQATRVLADGSQREVAVASLQPGDEILVRQGEASAVDGEVVAGEATLDQAAFTGETAPVAAARGDRVVGGSLVAEGWLQIRATAVGQDAAIGRVVTAMQRARASKAPIARLADRMAAVFVPIVVLIAIGTLLGWGLLAKDWASGLAAMIAVLVIACPCALGLATPTAVAVAIGRASELGLLVRDAAALEVAGNLDTIVLDKTGTLTTGAVKLVDIQALDPWQPHDLLRLAVGAERGSIHPIAKAIRAAVDECGIRTESIERDQEVRGAGVGGVVDGHSVVVGAPELLQRQRIDIEPLQPAFAAAQSHGRSIAAVAIDGKAAGVFCLQDRLRRDAAETVQALHAAGFTVHLLSGDQPGVVTATAQAVGITSASGGLSPEAKLAAIEQMEANGQRTVMVGDGINDAPALSGASLGIALASGTDVAASAAAITVAGNRLIAVPQVTALGRATIARIRQNLVLALGYNLLAIPAAAGLALPLTGHLLNPGLAAAAMAGSSLLVVGNSLRLRSWMPPS